MLTLAGIVSGAQIKYSKKGNRVCIFRLEDESAGVKCLVWAEAFGKYGEMIKDDALLIVDGRVETAERNDITFIVSEVGSLADAEPRNAKRLSIVLPEKEFEYSYFHDLFSVLSRTSGKCEVLIDIPAGAVEARLDASAFRVQGSVLLENELRSRGCEVRWTL